MSHPSRLKMTAAFLLSAISAFALILSAPQARAQDSDDAFASPTTERVIVVGPRLARGLIGGDVVDVSLSRAVRVDDLDLRTAEGALELRARIRVAATQICSRLSRLYPIRVDTSAPNCFRRTVDGAMASADAAIHGARFAAR